jgi:enediyne biosynthesis protein E4
MQRLGGRWSAIILSAIAVGGLGWCGWRWWDVRRNRNAMAVIDDAIRHGRYATATRDLSALLSWNPGSDQASYLLGVCEKALGRGTQADAAWGAIPPNSLYSNRAVASRMDLLIERGRLAEAEQLIVRSSDDRGSEGSALRMALIPLFVKEGRAEEAERLIESRWASLNLEGAEVVEQAVNLARLHLELRGNVPPAEPIREYLDRLGQLAPDDDRVWLGKANLAIRTGSYAEANRWLDDCLRRRPDDWAVWRARLEWSMRTDRLAEAQAALKHLPAERATAAEVHRLSAWMAARCDHIERERHELAALVAEAPENFEALERLENMGPQEQAHSSALKPWRPKVDIERDRTRYHDLYRRNQPARDAEEMARLAERLGHRFEAILFLTAAVAQEPDRTILRDGLRRLEQAAPEPIRGSQSLFDILSRGREADEPRSGVASLPGPLAQ